MTTVVPSVAIRGISPINYWASCNSGTPLHFDWEAGKDTGWRIAGLWEFRIPEFEIPCAFNRVAASGTVVPTGRSSGSFMNANSPAEDEIGNAMAELRAVVGAIREARPLPLAPDLDELLTRAAQSKGSPANIEEWAQQIAADISGLTD